MATGYEDIDSLMNQQNNLLNEQQKKQNDQLEENNKTNKNIPKKYNAVIPIAFISKDIFTS